MKKLMPGLLPIVVGIALFPIVLFSGFSLWKTNSYEDALLILNHLSKAQKSQILTTCNQLMSNMETSNALIESSPFDFMQIDFIRLSHSSCEVFLYKGPGKGVGYVVSKHSNNTSEFFWFNDFESWDRHPIVL
jgi:hypothetical protein